MVAERRKQAGLEHAEKVLCEPPTPPGKGSTMEEEAATYCMGDNGILEWVAGCWVAVVWVAGGGGWHVRRPQGVAACRWYRPCVAVVCWWWSWRRDADYQTE